MKTNEERFAILQSALSFLGEMNITPVLPTLCSPYGDDLTDFGFIRVEWAPYIWIGQERLAHDHELFTNHRVFAIGLSSVLACLQLDLKAHDKVLDMCAAPGIKSLYLQLLHGKKLELYVNDISHNRLERLRSLFTQFSVPLPVFSNQPGQSLLNRYDEAYFDAVIIDAPCSGEGNILKGDSEALQTWSPAKVKRLAKLQRKLVKAGLTLMKEDGQGLYATCTLNEYENEGVLRKAGVVMKQCQNRPLTYEKLEPKAAIRLLPSDQSIGFFIAKVR